MRSASWISGVKVMRPSELPKTPLSAIPLLRDHLEGALGCPVRVVEHKGSYLIEAEGVKLVALESHTFAAVVCRIYQELKFNGRDNFPQD